MMILMIMVMMVGLMQPMTETMMLKGLMQPMTDVKEIWGTVAIAMYMKGASIKIMMRTMGKSSDYYDDSDDNGDDGGADAADDGDDDAEGADAADDGCEGAMVMVLTATMAMTAMTTTMTMKMHPFYPKPTNTQLIAYKPFLRTVPIQPRPIQPMTSSMWADSADGIVDVG